MSTANLEGFLDRGEDVGRPTDIAVASFTAGRRQTEGTQAVIRYAPATRKERKSEERKPQPRVLRRLEGFLMEMEKDEARVAFVEDGRVTPYDMPADQLRRSGIVVKNQPFQMDEIELKLEGGLVVGYRFEPLAKPSDAYIEPLNFDAERKRKRDLILKEFSKAKA
jgi:hypothetical protein